MVGRPIDRGSLVLQFEDRGVLGNLLATFPRLAFDVRYVQVVLWYPVGLASMGELRASGVGSIP